MESEQKWRPLYCKEKSRAQIKMAETYCYLEEQFADDNSIFRLFLFFDCTFSIPFLSRQMWKIFLFDCSYRLVFLLRFFAEVF